MTEAAKLQAACTGSLEAVKVLCNCNTGCANDKRCKCFRAGLKCTSHCHGKLMKNKQKVVKNFVVCDCQRCQYATKKIIFFCCVCVFALLVCNKKNNNNSIKMMKLFFSIHIFIIHIYSSMQVCSWEGDFKNVYGRPRHPQSQGPVEQANGTIEVMISAMMEQEKYRNWPSLLPKIMYNLV